MRHDTFDLGQGIGRIRWSDDDQTVRSNYPHSVQTHRRRVTIPRFMRASREVSLMADLVFGQNGVVEVNLRPSLERRIPDWSTTRSATIARLATLFDLDGHRREWTFSKATVQLDESWDDFVLRVMP